jgi:hypothetical protein
MKIKSILGLAATGYLLCSCQSNTFQIDGYARSFAEGDTICLMNEREQTIAISIVCQGKFSFYGEIQKIGLYSVMAKEAPACQVSFFTEPGITTIELNSQPGTSRISGTRLNNEWQQLTDSIALMGSQIAKMLHHPASDTTAQKALAHTADSLHRQMSACILNTAQRNKDNPLGKYINENYKAPEFK